MRRNGNYRQPRRACTNNKKQLLGTIKQTSTSIKPTLTSPPPPVDDASWANFLFGALHTPVPLMPPPQITQGILHSPPEFNRVISIEDYHNPSIAMPSLSSLAPENITGDYHSGGRPLLLMRRPRLKLRPRSLGRPWGIFFIIISHQVYLIWIDNINVSHDDW